MKIPSCFLVLMLSTTLLSQISFADETAHGVSGGGRAGGGQGLPTCVDAAHAATLIATEKGSTIVNANTKETTHVYPKYKFIQSALSKDSDLELMARLVYSESKAAHCPSEASRLTDPIAAVVVNRVGAHDGDVRGVVFAKDQFASSLNDYTESGYKEFMCPSDQRLWQEAVSSVRHAQSAPVSSAKSYYLFMHFADNPAKMNKYNAVFNKKTAMPFAGSEGIRDCLRLFP